MRMSGRHARSLRTTWADRVCEERKRLLAAVGDELWGTELLRFTLQQAVAELSGLGGMVHLCGPGHGGGLRLVAASGLPSAFAQAWERIDRDAPLVPARALREAAFVWEPLTDTAAGERAGRRQGDGSWSWPAGTAMAAVPLLGPAGPAGALSVVTLSPHEPPARRRSFLRMLGRWAGEHLSRYPAPPPDPAGPGRRDQPAGSHLRQDLPTVGTWDWDVRTGRITWNAATLAILGVDPGTFDERIETWTSIVHPEDLPWVLADIDEAIQTGRMYGSEYRICRPDGTSGWVRARGRSIADENGRPARMVGTLMDITAVHDAIDTVAEPPARAAEPAAVTRADAERAAGIGRLTRALAEAITVQDVADASAAHILPLFGAVGLIVALVEGDHLRPVAFCGYTQEFIDRITRIPASGKLTIAQVLRERTPMFISSAEEYIERYPVVADLPAAGGKQAWAFLPLIASGRPVGTCVVSFAEPHKFTGEERTLLTALSGLVAQAVERARLYDKEHMRAHQMQRELLPRELPSLPAVTPAARYLPAGKDMEVGGDWYDVIPLSADRVAMVIGDVMGHGVAEAVTMGRLRTAVRTLADLELPPDELLAHLNDLVSELGDDFYATCLYLVYDPTTRTCDVTRAGHPPPAVVHPDGSVHFLDSDPNSPLGAATPPFDTVELEVPDGSLLVLYTDGLVESATLDIDQGMADLAAALGDMAPAALRPTPCREHAALPGGSGDHCAACLEALCDNLTSTLLPTRQGTADDTVLLIARTHALPAADMASWPLPDDPRAAGQAREHVRAQLSAWHLEDLSMTTELLASELVGNVVRHAKGPIRLRLLRSNVLTCEVSDGSLTTPRPRRAGATDEGGRGLQLISAIAHRWGTRYTATGKCVWTEQPLTRTEQHPVNLYDVLEDSHSPG
ncbi:Serine phosphatase RsbU, regulator of sigma subunit [[Actinomadura] parvosata subsp. kistnae]|nr:Serine phosphatase RsbU, regulator of sigma subunit [Actinomadura parvosata subsp. kistnae]